MKRYVTKREFELFRNWLINVVGVVQSAPTNPYELIRWQHHLPGKPMPICFKRDRSSNITLNTEAAKYYDDYCRRRDHESNSPL